jgi:hypothetical protein
MNNDDLVAKDPKKKLRGRRDGKSISSNSPSTSYSCSTLQILFDIGSIFAIIALQLVIEFPIALIDKVNRSVRVELR